MAERRRESEEELNEDDDAEGNDESVKDEEMHYSRILFPQYAAMAHSLEQGRTNSCPKIVRSILRHTDPPKSDTAIEAVPKNEEGDKNEKWIEKAQHIYLKLLRLLPQKLPYFLTRQDNSMTIHTGLILL